MDIFGLLVYVQIWAILLTIALLGMLNIYIRDLMVLK